MGWVFKDEPSTLDKSSIVEAAADLRVERGEATRATEGLPGDPPAPITSDLKLGGMDPRRRREVEWCVWLNEASKYQVEQFDLRLAVVELASLLQDETIMADWRGSMIDDLAADAVKVSEQYAKHFNHGTPNSILYLTVAELAERLDTKASGAVDVEATE
jgi:hypothetical protein